MKLFIDIENASGLDDIPSEEEISSWVTATLNSLPSHLQRDEAELSVRIVDELESQNLNHTYRRINKPTNVLSFPSELPSELELPLLGDMVVCAPVVIREAGEQFKTATAHWAHMLVHGTLHLLGYDHIEDDEAEQMEALEVKIICDLGFPNPYQVSNDVMFSNNAKGADEIP